MSRLLLRWVCSLSVLILLCVAAEADPLEPSDPYGGTWWVVIGSPDVEVYYDAVKDLSHPYWSEVERARLTAARCGFEIMTDQASRFDGFDPSRMAFVAGAFAERTIAEAALQRLTPCFADAYLKSGRYTDWD